MTKTATQDLLFEWTRPKEITVRQIPLEKIHVPQEYERQDSVREDEALTNSIRRNGVEQPIHVIAEGEEYTLVKGGRRLSISYVCRLPTIPAIVEPPAPEGVDPVAYRNRLRFHLSIRQDLTPSQKCDFILQTMEKYGMNQKQVANYLGLDAGTITNYLAVRYYEPSIVKLLDEGALNPHAARSFDGLKPEAQPKVLRALRKEFQTLAGGKLHRLVRTKFNPRTHADLYVSPEKTLAKLSRKQKGRRSRKRPRLTRSEKELLSSDLNLKEIELRDLEQEIRELKRANIICGPIVHAILRNQAIVAILPEEMLPELHRFSEIY